ncbi:YqhG family protein [Salirhabdus salicampi]|uniref:YqhG family protein n=1 Tax=Salirhabdus salicampi TaxID=476102 RepID=UPI0020C1D3F8|nr:YqhG family protein [Salirhabdus salicampi]MCP8616843.1 YqhG family protein [Salirhabdus salicampi]
MEQQAIHQFLHNYFQLNQCNILENGNGKLKVELTEQIDRLLMNRPFYWEYIKKTGQIGTPATLTFISNPERRDEEGEWIHFGSPRLHQIFRSLLSLGQFTLLYEDTSGDSTQKPLIPWLVTNVKIGYKGLQKKDETMSIGLHLLNGMMVFDFMERVEHMSFQTLIPDYRYTITPLIRIFSGYKRIENMLLQHIEKQDDSWAKQSYEHFLAEKEILDHFYHTYLEKGDETEREQIQERYESELNQLQKRLLPEVTIDVINGGLFYVTEQTVQSFMQ